MLLFAFDRSDIRAETQGRISATAALSLNRILFPPDPAQFMKCEAGILTEFSRK